MSNKRTGNYDNYVRLLKKYKVRHPMEKWSSESYTKESKENRIREYLYLSEGLMDEMKLTGYQRRDVKHLIKTVPLKSLHRKIGIECIILCLCIYVRKSHNDKNFRWQEYGVVKRYGLDCQTLLVVMTNLCIYFNRRIPLPMVSGVDKYGGIDYDDENIIQKHLYSSVYRYIIVIRKAIIFSFHLYSLFICVSHSLFLCVEV